MAMVILSFTAVSFAIFGVSLAAKGQRDVELTPPMPSVYPWPSKGQMWDWCADEVRDMRRKGIGPGVAAEYQDACFRMLVLVLTPRNADRRSAP